MDRVRLAQFVDAYVEDVAVPGLVAYGAIPCLSPVFDPSWATSGHLEEAARRVAAFADARPLGEVTAEVVRLPSRTPTVVVDVPATDPARAATTTLVYGHLDKQPPLGAWREGLDPFRPTREGDRLFGRGMVDDGYAPFAALGALEALAALGAGHGRVVILVEASEESGSPDLDAYLDGLAGRLGDVDLVVCLDSGGPTFDRLWVTSSLRGNLVVTVTARVLVEGVHSGVAGGIVPDSFRVLRRLLSRIEDEATGELILPELSVPIPGHRRREIQAVAAEIGEAAAGTFPAVDGVRLAGEGTAERIERATWRGALAVIGVEGIPLVAEGGNVLRPFTALKLSLRLPPTCDAAGAEQAVVTALTTDPPEGAEIRVDAEARAQGWNAPPLRALLAGVVDAASTAHFGAPSRSLGLGGSIPFLATLAGRYPAADVLATGILGPGSNAHGPNEVLELSAMKSLTACLAEVLAAGPEPGSRSEPAASSAPAPRGTGRPRSGAP